MFRYCVGKFLFGLVVGLVFVGMAKAETLSWEPPTSREDGQTLDPASEISQYVLYCEGVGTVIPGSTVDGTYPVNKAEMLSGYGSHQCYMTAVDLEGRESQPSNSIEIVWEPAEPSSPTNLIYITGEI